MKNLFGTILLAIIFLISSCDSERKCLVLELCGNGKMDNYEECDSNSFAPMYSRYCTEWGYAKGYVKCTEFCALDFSECTEYQVCEVDDECDHTNSQNLECKDIGKWGSSLQCSFDCQFNDEYCDDVYFISQGFPGDYRFDTVSDLTTDASGNLYVLGYTGSALEGFENSDQECTTHDYYVEIIHGCDEKEEKFYPCWDNFLYKLSPDGTILWKKQWGTIQNDRGFAIFDTGTTIGIIVFNDILFPIENFDPFFYYYLDINQATLLSFDYAGNQLNSKTIPIYVTHPRKIVPFGDKLLVSGNNGFIEPEQALDLIDPETSTETSILPDATQLSGIVLDNAVLDSTWLATLVHDEEEMQLSKINIHDGSRIILNSSPDNHTVTITSQWDYNIYKTPPSLLLKHNNSDLYYITQEKLSDSTCISTLFRVTADGSKLAEYVFPDYDTSFSNYNLAQTDNGNLVITRTFIKPNNIDSPDIPPDYYAEIIEATIIDENLSTPEIHYKNIDNHLIEAGNNTDQVAGIECFGDYVYIFGRKGVEKVRGFIWRLGLNDK